LARKRSLVLTEAELKLMNVLWERKSGTVNDVVEALPRRLPLAYSTVLTTLRILEHKGYIQHSKEGRAFVYYPVVDRSEARRSALKHLLSRFFENSPELLVLNVLEQERIDGQELKRLKKMIKESE
jgi:predicted transcriptional regulator